MGIGQLSPLESALIAAFHELYGTQGFPAPERIQVKRRENTGVGRYTEIEAEDHVDLDDGCVDLGGRFIEMTGVPNGLMAIAHVRDHRLEQLEIVVYGEDQWDGVERDWSIA